VPGEAAWYIRRRNSGPRKACFYCMDWRNGFHPDRYSVFIRINGEIVKAKAFTKKRR